MDELLEKQIIPRLKKNIRKAGSIAKWAKVHGYSRQFVGDVIKKKRPMPDGMLEAINVVRKVEVKWYVVETE